MDTKTLIATMYAAVDSDRGLALDEVNAVELRTEFYKARKVAAEPAFDDLSFQLAASGTTLLIVRKSRMLEAGALKRGQKLTFGDAE